MKKVNQNSVDVYREIAHTLPDARRAVYMAIKYMEKATAKHVAKYLDKQLHKVSGRFTELRELGLIQECRDEDGNKIRVNRSILHEIVEKKEYFSYL